MCRKNSGIIEIPHLILSFNKYIFNEEVYIYRISKCNEISDFDLLWKWYVIEKRELVIWQK